jgi:cytoskeleton protein RodZ
LLALGVALVVGAVLLATVALVNRGSVQPQAAPNVTPSPSPVIDVTPTRAPSPTPSPPASPSSPPAPSPTAQATPPATAPTVALRFNAESWVRIRDAQGKIILLGLQPAGTVRTYTGPRFYVEIGNAGGVLVSIKGSPPRVTGATNQVVRFTVTGP